MEKQVTCPGCKKSLSHKLVPPLLLHCNACTAVFTLHLPGDHTFVKTYYNPPIDCSVLKLGVTGIYLNSDFELIGRIRSVNSFAISNEWLMYFQDGTYKWLTESTASYFVVDNQSILLNSREVKDKKAGSNVKIKDHKYRITEISKQLLIETEGEIPLDAYSDDDYFKYELINLEKENEFATIVLHNKDELETFFSKKVELNSLDLKGVTDFKDWI
ncbi:MAG TPA: hypothetical protein VFF27_01795 [Bacteroidia bacterium]|jgi:hypothetical protein|nr:hypothetical protein [Bacteroidia bacterium]